LNALLFVLALEEKELSRVDFFKLVLEDSLEFVILVAIARECVKVVFYFLEALAKACCGINVSI
jgi:hypothetical protein